MNIAIQKIQEMFLLEKKTPEEISKELKIPLDAVEKVVKNYKKRKKSNIETIVGDILREIYPKFKIEEQVSIGSLFLDYFIPSLRLAVEVDGIQHSKIVSHFHGKNTLGQHFNFSHQKDNDRKKERLAEENYIYLIRVNYDEDINVESIRSIINEQNQNIIDNLNRYTSEIRVYK